MYSVPKGFDSAPAQAAVYQMISSLEKKPAKGQIPAIARVAIHMTTHVTGMYLRSPPMLRMSCSSRWPSAWCAAWCMEWMTAPAPRKRSALKNECVTRWKTAAVKAPTPAARNMKPSWETVE